MMNRLPHGVTHYRTGINPAVCEESGRTVSSDTRRRDAFAVGSLGQRVKTKTWECLTSKGASRPIHRSYEGKPMDVAKLQTCRGLPG
ncbi:hypothetical protein ES703_11740 [subsurface metagenome]